MRWVRASPLGALAEPLRRSPLLVSVALGLWAGDVLGGQAPAPAAAPLAVAGLGLLSLGPACRRVALALLAFAWGTVAAQRVYRPDFLPDHIAAAPMHRPLQFEGVLLSDAEARMGGGGRLRVGAERIDDGQGWRAAHGQVLLTLRRMEGAWHAGDRVRMPVSLRRPRNFGNPGEFDYAGYLARRRVYVTAFADSDAGVRRVGQTANWLAARLGRWRRGVAALFVHTLPAPQAAVLSALIVGTTTALPDDLRQAFNRAGVSHVLSISGLHVGLVAAAGYTACRWLLARSRWLLLATNVPKLAVALSVMPVLLYAGIAGSNVATLRSVLMILVFLGAVVVDRQRHLIVSLAAAAIVILLCSPGTARDISFQLSFAAVLGLALGMERFWSWWREWEEARLVRLRGWTARLWRPVAVYAVVSISALASTAPLTALHFNQVSLVALFANALVVPLLGSAAVILGLLAATAYVISAPLAALCVIAAGPFLWLGVWLVETFAALPYAAFRVVTPTPFELALLFAGLLALVRMSGGARVRVLAVLAVLALGDGAWWYADRHHHSDLRVTFLSVGQGDSAVVEFPRGEVMVVDGGGVGGAAFDVGERVIAPFLWSRKIARVDYLVLSHPDWDHYGGLAFLAAHFAPREFWSSGAPSPSARFTELQQALDDSGIRRLVLRRGARRRIGAVVIAVQSPPPAPDGLGDNDESLVFTLGFAGTQLLFTGDIEAPAEDDVVAAADGTLASAVIKVPHHGSRTSSSGRFLDAVTPQLAVVSAGFENRFGFPHGDVLRRYAARACTVARTDLDGAVQVRVSAQGNMELQRPGGTADRWPAAQIGVDSPGGEG
jgi:competence protein ComEC